MLLVYGISLTWYFSFPEYVSCCWFCNAIASYWISHKQTEFFPLEEALSLQGTVTNRRVSTLNNIVLSWQYCKHLEGLCSNLTTKHWAFSLHASTRATVYWMIFYFASWLPKTLGNTTSNWRSCYHVKNRHWEAVLRQVLTLLQKEQYISELKTHKKWSIHCLG